MGYFFRKRFKIAPGLYLNASKKGFGFSAGVRGCHISVNSKGETYLNAGVKGLYYREKLTTNLNKYGNSFSSIDYKNIGIYDLDKNFATIINIDNSFLWHNANTYINFKVIGFNLVIVIAIVILMIIFISGQPISLLLFFLPLFLFKKREKQLNFYNLLEKQCKIKNSKQPTLNLALFFNDIKEKGKILNCDKDFLYYRNIGIGNINGFFKEQLAVVKVDDNYLFFTDNGLIIKSENSLFLINYKILNCTMYNVQYKYINPPSYCNVISSIYEHTNKDGSPNKRYKNNNQIGLCEGKIIVLEVKDKFQLPFMLLDNQDAEKMYSLLKELLGT